MKYKLVAIDLDGTLLNDKDEIGNITGELMKRSINLGVKFAMCSSRIYLATKYYNVQIDKTQPIITSNGGLVTINEKAIFSYPLASEDLIKIISIVHQEKKDIHFSFGYGNYSKNYLCTNRIASVRRITREYNQTVPKEFSIDTKLLKEPIRYIKENNIESYKISFMDNNPHVLDKLKTSLKNLNKYEITSSEANNIEITQKGVSKGKALKKLADYYGYSLDECVAIGNDMNDLSMIREAGIGVAMKNANPYVKEHANYITKYDNNNEGVADIIEKVVLS